MPEDTPEGPNIPERRELENRYGRPGTWTTVPATAREILRAVPAKSRVLVAIIMICEAVLMFMYWKNENVALPYLAVALAVFGILATRLRGF